MPSSPLVVSKLYGGTVTVEFFEKPYHKYLVDGKARPSVTKITGMLNKPHLVPWSSKMACNFLRQQLELGVAITPELLDIAQKQYIIRATEGADIGKLIHKYAEDSINYQLGLGNKPELPEDPRVLNGVTAFLEWARASKVKFISAERNVYSKKYDFAGKMDAEAIINGKHVVIDFKTANVDKKTGQPVIYNEYRYQTAAYEMAAAEEGTVYDDNRYIIHFNKANGDFSVHQIDNLERDFSVFVGLRRALEVEELIKQEYKVKAIVDVE